MVNVISECSKCYVRTVDWVIKTDNSGHFYTICFDCEEKEGSCRCIFKCFSFFKTLCGCLNDTSDTKEDIDIIISQ
jgi:hypothetical protein